MAAAHATVLLNSGIVSPGYLGAGLLSPRLAAPIAPVAVARGIYSPGLIGAAPYAYGGGIVSLIGLRGAGILAAPGVVKTIY